MKYILSILIGLTNILQMQAQTSDSILLEKDSIPVTSELVNDVWKNWQVTCDQIIVLKNEQSLLPLMDLDQQQTVAVAFNHWLEWRHWLWRYQQMDVLQAGDVIADSLNIKVQDADRILLLADDIDELVTDSVALNWLKLVSDSKTCCLIYTGEPSDLDQLKVSAPIESIVLTQHNDSLARDLATQVIFGAIPASGKLAEDINAQWKAGEGIQLAAIDRLSYTIPEALGMNGGLIDTRVDSIVNASIDAKAFPGCRVMVAVKGQVIFNKSYGYHTYDAILPVQEHDIFDLASVTKITGPLPLLMKAKDDGLLDLDRPFAHYWTDWQKGFLKCSNKAEMTVREVLTHQAGLQPYINYYPMTLKNGHYRPKWYGFSKDNEHTLQIDDHLFLSNRFKKEIYKKIRKSPVSDEKKYKYSGLSFMIYPELLGRLYQKDYAELLKQYFFAPLGASTLGYKPKTRFPLGRIMPTEYDPYYRHQLIHGYVHDEAAAVMGGVSGNAGLFASAHDLAKLMQMYLQMGHYGGHRYISEGTLKEFSDVQYRENDNRRGVGFDKPLFGNDTLSIQDSYPAPGVSPSSFGHSGFTGTFVWVDPHYELMYIFLSNRVHPTRNNPKIYQLNVRPSIQQVFYDELKKLRLRE